MERVGRETVERDKSNRQDSEPAPQGCGRSSSGLRLISFGEAGQSDECLRLSHEGAPSGRIHPFAQRLTMALPLDFGLLESGDKFQDLCFYLARKQFPNAVPVAHGSWDGGRDILMFSGNMGDVVWQCKFTRQSLSKLKPKVAQSLAALDPSRKILKWILCLSVDASGDFHDWLREKISAEFPFIASWELWDKQSLLQRLDENQEVLEVFFYPVWKALESRFRTEELELVRFELEPDCGWSQPDPTSMQFAQGIEAMSDLVFDLVVRNRGTLQSLLHSIRVEVFDVHRHLRGLPGADLLRSQHTYVISLRDRKPGSWIERLEPPLTINAGRHQRFSLQLADIGYAWTGYVRITLVYGDKQMALPCIFLSA